jgi:hypothetical protein
MKYKRVSTQLRRRVSEAAGFRCGYCLTLQAISGARLVVDHIIPEAVGGVTAEHNLWLACHSCNEFKGAQSHAHDPKTGRRVRLFNPRTQAWTDHFTWDDLGSSVVGISPTGRATVIALRLNHMEIVLAREQWVRVGWWPPIE